MNIYSKEVFKWKKKLKQTFSLNEQEVDSCQAVFSSSPNLVEDDANLLIYLLLDLPSLQE